MPVIPSSLDSLLFLFAGAFSAPTFETFRYLVVGFLARVGEHSVCGMLQGAGLAREWHHSRAHAFFAERKWCPDRLGLLLLDFLIARLVPAGEPIVLAVDDTLFKRRGKQVWGAAWQYDGSLQKAAGSQKGYGNNFVVMTLVVRLPFLARPVSLPVLSRLWRPEPKPKDAGRGQRQSPKKRPQNPDYPSKPRLARQLLNLVIARYPDRQIELTGDSAYATKALADVPERVTVTSRLRSNAQLYEPKPPPTGKRGRPRVKGARLPKLKQIANNPQTVWAQTEIVRSGKRHTVLTHALQALWYDVWAGRPVQVVLVKDPERSDGYDIALVSTNMRATPAQIIERYDERWSIEVCFEDARQITGIGEARNRVKLAVQRTVPLGLLCQSLVICWYALYGNADQDVRRHRHRSPWYRHKHNPSYQDMLSSMRRALIAAQYSPATGRAPTQRQITNPTATLKSAAA
ncbi:MAG: IS701 family transposase [Solirubrobacteraceae bacterium]